MTAQWVKYDGSDEQIAEINNSENFILKRRDGELSFVLRPPYEPNEMDNETTDSYLICAPHPYADMICQWARTGQPVYARVIGGVGSHECHEYFPPFARPDKFEYSFTPFEGEV